MIIILSELRFGQLCTENERTLVDVNLIKLIITDVNNLYIGQGNLTWSLLEGWWTDAGTFDSLLKASNLVAGGGANNC